jgi:hypothetical protein
MSSVRLILSAAIALVLCLAVPAEAADCYSVGERVAAQNGGRLARASSQTRGGKTVCVVVVLVPGKGGQRPRRAEIVVPAD